MERRSWYAHERMSWAGDAVDRFVSPNERECRVGAAAFELLLPRIHSIHIREPKVTWPMRHLHVPLRDGCPPTDGGKIRYNKCLEPKLSGSKPHCKQTTALHDLPPAAPSDSHGLVGCRRRASGAFQPLEWSTWQHLPVFFDGRVMPLDTLARETVATICGTANPRSRRRNFRRIGRHGPERRGQDRRCPRPNRCANRVSQRSTAQVYRGRVALQLAGRAGAVGARAVSGRPRSGVAQGVGTSPGRPRWPASAVRFARRGGKQRSARTALEQHPGTASARRKAVASDRR